MTRPWDKVLIKVNVAMWPFYITIATIHTNLTRKSWVARKKKGCVNSPLFLVHDKTCLSGDTNFKKICFKLCLWNLKIYMLSIFIIEMFKELELTLIYAMLLLNLLIMWCVEWWIVLEISQVLSFFHPSRYSEKYATKWLKVVTTVFFPFSSSSFIRRRF